MELNFKNYHSIQANQEFMSRSQYIEFQDCEARALAKVRSEWVEQPSNALLVGQYVHSWSSGSRRDFIAENPGMFKKDGSLKAEYLLADKMIATLEADPLAMWMLEGQKEVIFTAEFAGATWKVMADVHNPERRKMVDLKTTRSITETHWSEEFMARVTFIEQYKYVLQAALYCEIERLASGRPEGDWLDFYAVAVSKEAVPDKEVIDLRDPARYAEELESISIHMPRILSVKSGQVEPVRCGRCDYCRATKKLAGAVHYSQLSA